MPVVRIDASVKEMLDNARRGEETYSEIIRRLTGIVTTPARHTRYGLKYMEVGESFTYNNTDVVEDALSLQRAVQRVRDKYDGTRIYWYTTLKNGLVKVERKK